MGYLCVLALLDFHGWHRHVEGEFPVVHAEDDDGVGNHDESDHPEGDGHGELVGSGEGEEVPSEEHLYAAGEEHGEHFLPEPCIAVGAFVLECDEAD